MNRTALWFDLSRLTLKCTRPVSNHKMTIKLSKNVDLRSWCVWTVIDIIPSNKTALRHDSEVGSWCDSYYVKIKWEYLSLILIMGT